MLCLAQFEASCLFATVCIEMLTEAIVFNKADSIFFELVRYAVIID